MTISDISTIRVNVWKDMDTDSVGGKTIALGAGATNDGAKLTTTGAANSYAQATGYKPVFTSQGTIIFRANFPSGCVGASTPLLANDGAGNPFLGFQGQYFIVNNNFCSCRPTNTSAVWETIVGTWGPAGLKGYRNGSPDGTNAFTGTPSTPTFDLTFGALDYNGGKVQNVAMMMDFCAILNRQLSDAEVLDLSSNPSQLWPSSGSTALPQVVSTSADDARYSSNSTYQNGTQVFLGQFSGLFGNLVSRFTQITIPKGSTINSALLSVYVSGTTSTPVLMIGKVGDEANAAMPTTYAACVAAAKTAGTAYSKTWASSSGYQTVDITAEVQALVNRSDWASGNAIVVYLLDNGSASGKYAPIDMYDMDVTRAPKIDLVFTPSGGGGSSVSKQLCKLGSKRSGFARGGL